MGRDSFPGLFLTRLLGVNLTRDESLLDSLAVANGSDAAIGVASGTPRAPVF